MSDPGASLKLYKEVVDLLAGLHRGVHRVWVMERGWPKTEENNAINEFVASLSADQKEILVGLLESAREGGIHDTLVVLNDRMAINGLRFVENGVEMAHQPFDCELYYDWTCRRMGDDWPDDED
jgi:hypothetical protein